MSEGFERTMNSEGTLKKVPDGYIHKKDMELSDYIAVTEVIDQALGENDLFNLEKEHRELSSIYRKIREKEKELSTTTDAEKKEEISDSISDLIQIGKLSGNTEPEKDLLSRLALIQEKIEVEKIKLRDQ